MLIDKSCMLIPCICTLNYKICPQIISFLFQVLVHVPTQAIVLYVHLLLKICLPNKVIITLPNSYGLSSLHIQLAI